jgi:hypothetical protein
LRSFLWRHVAQPHSFSHITEYLWFGKKCPGGVEAGEVQVVINRLLSMAVTAGPEQQRLNLRGEGACQIISCCA